MESPIHPRCAKYTAEGNCSLLSPNLYEPPCTPSSTGMGPLGTGTFVEKFRVGSTTSTVRLTVAHVACEKLPPLQYSACPYTTPLVMLVPYTASLCTVGGAAADAAASSSVNSTSRAQQQRVMSN